MYSLRFPCLQALNSSRTVFSTPARRNRQKRHKQPADHVHLGWSPEHKHATEDRSVSTRSFGADDFGTASEPKLVRQRQPTTQNIGYSGVFWLLLVNFGLFAADHVLHLPWASSLYLYHAHPRWWQFLSFAFCHGSWQHLSSNSFMLYVFGRIVEEEEGTFGVWATYCLCALGASIASVLMQPPNVVSLGASGAVFGLFTVSVLIKLSFNFRKLLECVILGQFVIQQLLSEAQMQSKVWAGGKGLVIAGTQVGHLAHLAGALAGVLLVLLLSRLPAADKS